MRQAITEFMLALLTCAVVMLALSVAYLGRQLDSSSLANAQARYEIEILLAEYKEYRLQLGPVPGHVVAIQGDMAALDYRMDILLNASRTGWWSRELLALVGREYLYRKEAMSNRWALQVYTNPLTKEY